MSPVVCEGLSPSDEDGSMRDSLSRTSKTLAAAPLPTLKASMKGAACPMFMAPIRTLKNTCPCHEHHITTSRSIKNKSSSHHCTTPHHTPPPHLHTTHHNKHSRVVGAIIGVAGLNNKSAAVPEGDGVRGVDDEPCQPHAEACEHAPADPCLPGMHKIVVVPGVIIIGEM